MGCERWIEAISALADGEDPGIDVRLVEAHLDRCASCREFRRHLGRSRASLRVRVAERIPDLSRRIVKLNAIADRARWRLVRGLLAVVAVEIVALSLPALVLGQEHATGIHSARHFGAFAVAYGVVLLVVVVRPARARSVLPVALTLALALLITAVVDITEGRVPLWGEARHIPEILSVVLLWLMAAPSLHRAPHREQTSPDVQLHLVDDDPSELDTGTQAM